jgi:hypothetical protein
MARGKRHNPPLTPPRRGWQEARGWGFFLNLEYSKAIFDRDRTYYKKSQNCLDKKVGKV